MSPKFVFWHAQDTDNIALLQTLAGAGSLALNGGLSQPDPGTGSYFNTGPLVLPNMVRKITLTSANNLSAINFTITGISGGVAVSEVLAGPNANTVTSVEFYSSITSITTSGAAAAVSAGIGSTGWIYPVTLNYNASNFNVSYSVTVTNNGGNITYSGEATAYDITELPASDWANLFVPLTGMSAQTGSVVANYTFPSRYATVQVTASTGAATLAIEFIQQGIRG